MTNLVQARGRTSRGGESKSFGFAPPRLDRPMTHKPSPSAGLGSSLSSVFRYRNGTELRKVEFGPQVQVFPGSTFGRMHAMNDGASHVDVFSCGAATMPKSKLAERMTACPSRWHGYLLVLVFLLADCFGLFPAKAQSLQDYFTNRVTISSATGVISQNNSTATVEVGEPKHGGKPGGHSLWISWVAPTNGVIRFRTETSDFDTLLSAYKFDTTNGSTFADLREVARADDSDGFGFESEIEFGVVTGERYEIAVDGYYGATGNVDFRWTFDDLKNPPPQFLNTLADRSVNIGDTVTLAFNLTNAGAGNFKWFRNGTEVGNSTNLTIASFSPSDVGRYVLRVAVGGGVQFFSVPVEIQINTEGAVGTLAQGKLLDSQTTPLIGNPGGSGFRFTRLSAGVVRGYNGSQIFNTTYALVDTNEPPHCGVASGKSYWLIYQPPTNGTVTLDTQGSTYDTVMEAYTYNGALGSFTNLISLDCAHDNFASNTAARIVLPVAKSRQYVLVVAGVNGAFGTAWLNYDMNTNLPPQPPAIVGLVGPRAVIAGETIVLTAPVTGAPPLFFTWTKNGEPIAGEHSATLSVSGLTAGQSADYSFIVTNDLGSVTGKFTVKALEQPWCLLLPIEAGLQLSFPTRIGQNYIVEEATGLQSAWSPWPGSLVGNGHTNAFNVPNAEGKFYRVRTE